MSAKPTLWMGDLEPFMDEFFIRNAFDYYGEPVISVKMIRNRTTGIPANYCFVEFESVEKSQRVLHHLNGKPLPNTEQGKVFKLNSAAHNKDAHSNPVSTEFSVFVGDLGSEVDSNLLFSEFSKEFRSVLTAKVVTNQDGTTRGFGFVRFNNSEDQGRALLEMNRRVIGKSTMKVSPAVPKRQGEMGKGRPNPSQGNYDWSAYYNQDWSQQWQDYYSGAGNATAYGSQPQQQPTQLEGVVEPVLEDDISAVNETFIRKANETYKAFEQYRWIRPAFHKLANPQ